MLEFMRRHARSWFIKVLLGAIIVSFIAFFGWSRYSSQANRVASVNGTVITIKYYKTVYDNLLRRYQNITRANLSDEMIQSLKGLALENIINRILKLEEVKRLKLSVSPEELKESIRQNPAFQINGRFDREHYLRVLSYNGLNPSQYEKEHSIDLAIGKIDNLVKDSVKISKQELLDLYSLENEKVSLRFIGLAPSSYTTKIHPKENELKAFFERQRDRFILPAKVKVTYMVFDPADLKKELDIPEEMIKKAYDAGKDRFRQPKKIRVRHILIKVRPNQEPEEKTKALKKAQEVLQEAKKGIDFATLARKYSEDEKTAKDGGDLGFIQKGQMVKPFEDAAFALKEGEISPIVETRFGYHIIKVEKVIEARTKPFSEVKEMLKEELKDKTADEKAFKKAREAYLTLFRGGSIEEVSKVYDRPLQTTGFFEKGGFIQGLDVDKAFYDAVFELKPGDFSEVIKSNGKYYLVYMLDRKEARSPKFDEVKEKVRKAFIEEEAKKLAARRAKEILEDLKNGKSLEEVANQEGVEISETDPFTRLSGYIPGIGFSDELVEDAFTMSKQRPYTQKPYFIGNRYIIAMLKARKEIDLSGFEKDMQRYRSRLLGLKQYRYLQKWSELLRSRAKIVKYKEFEEL